ncbi:MAG: hypothetical protein M3Y69_02535 [Verrucomicrobiota bacterium]|nr:hypothetical protein [Verrucomicrobiota bacterium]
MNEFSDLEAELKQLQPRAVSPQLATRIETALAQERAPELKQFRGARAASLQLAAACGNRLRRWRARSADSFGRLPDATDGQPALPGRMSWLVPGLGAAAVAILIVLGLGVPKAPQPPQRLAVTTPAPVTKGFVPDGLTRVVYNTRDEGLVYPGSSAQPVRRVRSRGHETLQWTEPGTGASLRVSYPTDEVELIPISGQ